MRLQFFRFEWSALAAFHLLLPLIALSAAAEADPDKFDNFNNGYGVLAGPAYVDLDGRILLARVAHPNADGSVEVEAEKKMHHLPADKVAVIDDASCWRGITSICIGDPLPQQSNPGQKVLGYFPPPGDVIINEEGTLKRKAVKSPLASAPALPEGGLAAVAEKLRAKQRLHLRDFLQTWSRGTNAPPPPPESCLNHELQNRYLKIEKGALVSAACAPQVLYSWSLPHRSDWFRAHYGAARAWPMRRLPFNLFAARAPAATFGYGSYDESGGLLMRIELKPGVKFRYLGINAEKINCADMPKSKIHDSVFVRLVHKVEPARLLGETSSEDFFLCSMEPVKAWSEGMRADYDEFSRDVQRALSAQRLSDWPAYTISRRDSAGPFRPVFLDNIQGDAHPFTQRQLINSFKRFLRLAAEDRGVRFENPAGRKKGD